MEQIFELIQSRFYQNGKLHFFLNGHCIYYPFVRTQLFPSLVLRCFESSLTTFPTGPFPNMKSTLMFLLFTRAFIESLISQTSPNSIYENVLQNELKTVVHWGKRWHVSFKASKGKFLCINQLRDNFLSFISIADAML